MVKEVLEEMAKHPGLAHREIPFVILGNKSDMPGSIEEKELGIFLKVDDLKKLNVLKYKV